ncbi:molybdopterin-dependent oxidoreductase [Ellagibacter isourolithinifaciens]|uniref:molybdopterin-dependent oxidoreductase n=1 Tax=Ellagibacter isourolithinifaciens TaxID=2137581 RepID=UPI003F89E6CC
MEFKNDLGKPWRYEEDGCTVTRTCAWSAPGCHPVGCGLKVYVRDGKVVKVEGDENHPVTKGRLCVRCLAMKDFLYHEDRVIYPMKRAKEDRGKSKWERCSWDDAIDVIKSNYDRIRSDYGVESMIALMGTGRQGNIGGTGAHRTLGTPNGCYPFSGFSCYGPRVSITMDVVGSSYPEIDYAGGLPGGYDDPAYKIPELIVQWGKEPIASNPDGLFGHAVIDLMKRGAKLMTIDPRVTWTGARAAYRLQLRPGTDAALAMAFLNVIINENLYDHDFVERWTYGFEQLSERVQEMPPSKAAEICEVPEEKIVEAARAYANAKPAAIAWGVALDQNPNGAQAGQAILALMSITGNMDVPGGQVLVAMNGGDGGMQEDIDSVGWPEMAQELRDKIIGHEEFPFYTGGLKMSQADRQLDALETDKPYPIKLVWIGSTNPIAPTCSAQPKRWYNALKRVDFVFATDTWITPTIQACADVVLPIASSLEQETCVPTHYGGSPNYVGALNKCVQCGEAIGEWEIYRILGLALNPEKWEGYEKDYKEFYDKAMMRGYDFDYAELQEKVVIQRDVYYRKYETGLLRPDGKVGFNTSTGRINLYSPMFASVGEDPLPYYREAPISKVSTPDIAKDYPLIMMTGAREFGYFHSEGRQIAPLRDLCPDPLCEVNPLDAKKYGVKDGEWIKIENQFGFCMFKAKLTEIVKPGMIMAQHGWWFPEEDGEAPHLFGVWKSNVNNLVPHSRMGKLGFGAPFRTTLVKISPATAEDFEAVDVDGIEMGDERIAHTDNFYRIDNDQLDPSAR